MDLDAVFVDLNDKISYVQEVFRPEYAPYLIAAATMLIGWLLTSCIFHVIWILLTPLTVSVIAIVLICAVTSNKWCFQQLGANLEEIMNNLVHRFQMPR